MRQVVRNQQRGTAHRNVFPTLDPHLKEDSRNRHACGLHHPMADRAHHLPASAPTRRAPWRAHSALVPSKTTLTDSDGIASIAAATVDFGTGMRPSLQENAVTDRASVMLSNSKYTSDPLCRARQYSF